MVDLDEFRKVLDYADVFAIGFHLFPQRLFIDARSNEQQGPMIALVEPVDSVEARFFWLGRERPSFGAPERFMFVPWPHSLNYLEECGVLERIRDRLVKVSPNMAERFESVRSELRTLERNGTIEAIRGEEHYKSIWSAAH